MFLWDEILVLDKTVDVNTERADLQCERYIVEPTRAERWLDKRNQL